MALSSKQSEGKQLNLKTVTWGDLTWVDIVQPTSEATQYLAEHYSFNPLDLEDCLSPRQIAKVETYPEYLFILFHLPVYDKVTRKSTRKQWSAFIGDKFLVTLRPGEFKSVDALFRQCELKEEYREEYLSHGSGYLMYRILDRMIDSYFPVLNAIMSKIEDIEDAVFDEDTEAGKEISVLRQDIITQRRVMFPTRQMLTELEKELGRFSRMDLTIYFSDLMDHMNKVCDTLDEFEEVIEVFKDADYVLSGYRANRVTRILAILLAVGVPFLVVTAVCTMHLVLSTGKQSGSSQTFFLLLAILLVIVGVILYLFRRKHLI
jgi:magnesium transporter